LTILLDTVVAITFASAHKNWQHKDGKKREY